MDNINDANAALVKLMDLCRRKTSAEETQNERQARLEDAVRKVDIAQYNVQQAPESQRRSKRSKLLEKMEKRNQLQSKVNESMRTISRLTDEIEAAAADLHQFPRVRVRSENQFYTLQDHDYTGTAVIRADDHGLRGLMEEAGMPFDLLG